MLIGIGFISFLTATIASTFVASDDEEDMRLDELVETVRRVEQRLDRSAPARRRALRTSNDRLLGARPARV